MNDNIRGICPDCVTDKLAEFQANFPEVKVGDHVKTEFKNAAGASEHMWVQVEKIGQETFSGSLANSPIFVNLKEGDPVTILKSEVWEHLKS